MPIISVWIIFYFVTDRMEETYSHGSSPTSIISPSSSVYTISHLLRGRSCPLISNISSSSSISCSYPSNMVRSTARPTATPCIWTFCKFEDPKKKKKKKKSFRTLYEGHKILLLNNKSFSNQHLGATSGWSKAVLLALNLLWRHLQLSQLPIFRTLGEIRLLVRINCWEGTDLSFCGATRHTDWLHSCILYRKWACRVTNQLKTKDSVTSSSFSFLRFFNRVGQWIIV